MARGRPRLDRAREDTAVVSVDDLVSEAKKYLSGWIKTLGKAGAATEEDGKVEPGNVTAAIAGIKIITDYLSQTQGRRAEKMLDKVSKARRQSVKDMKSE